jgi:AraC-like DNA-binding protein
MKLHRCSYGEFVKQKIIGPITWPFFDLLVIHQGQVAITIANETQYKLARGEALLIYPNSYFSGKVLSETSLASVQHFSLTPSDNDALPHLDSYKALSNGAQLYSVDGLVITDIERSLAYNQTLLPTDFIAQMQVNILHLILGQLSHEEQYMPSVSKHKGSLNQLVDSFLLHPEQPIIIDHMAAEINLSPSHFRAEFVKRYGEPPQRYLLRLRMKVACQMLEQGYLPIKTISAALGYDDISCFYRHFKKIVKTTPLLYRQQKRVIG